MIDINEIIANNIAILRKQTDLAEVGGKQIKLSTRTMNAGELRDIAKYLGTTEYRFDNYLRKFDKTRKDFEGMPDVIKAAWRDEFEQYEASEREKQMERSASQHGYRVSGKDNLLSGGTYTPNPEEEDAYALLADIGVPFGSDGEPLGIGWDD